MPRRPTNDTSKPDDAKPDRPERNDWHKLHLWQFQAVRDLGAGAMVIGIILLGFWLRSITVPLLIALTLAYLFEPVVVRFMDRFGWSRPLAVGSLVAAVGVLFAASLVALAISTVQAVDLVRTLPQRAENLVTLVDEQLPAPFAKPFLDSVSSLVTEEPEAGTSTGELDEKAAPDPSAGPNDQTPTDEQPIDTDQLADQLGAWVRANLGSIFKATMATTGGVIDIVTRVLGSLVYLVFMLFLIPFYFFAFSTGWPALRDYVAEVFPPEHATTSYELLKKMDTAVSGFVRGRVVICAIMGVMLAIGWWFCDVPYWLVLGLLTGVFSAVPYLGGVGVPLAIILLWVGQGDVPQAQRMAWWGIILWPSLVFAVVQLVEGYLLTPVIAGKATNLGPVSILVAVLAGGAVAGMYGMILAIPAAACVKILTTDLFVPRLKQWARGQRSDFLPIDRE